MGTWEYMWSVNQLSDASLSLGSSPTTLTSATGATIAEMDRAKTATFTATNALFDLALLAAIVGDEVEHASTTHKITTPVFEEITVEDPATAIKLAHMPKTDVEAIYKLNGDATVGIAYSAGTAASDTEFVYSAGSITVPSDAQAGDIYLVVYEYESTEAVAVTDYEDKFPVACKFVAEVLGFDICNPSELIYAYIIFPNAKLSSSVDIALATEGGMPITITMMPGFCEKKKKLFQIIIPNPEADLQDSGSGGGTP